VDGGGIVREGGGGNVATIQEGCEDVLVGQGACQLKVRVGDGPSGIRGGDKAATHGFREAGPPKGGGKGCVREAVAVRGFRGNPDAAHPNARGVAGPKGRVNRGMGDQFGKVRGAVSDVIGDDPEIVEGSLDVSVEAKAAAVGSMEGKLKVGEEAAATR
jgi:hypothetical protein